MIRGLRFLTVVLLALLCLTVFAEDVETTHHQIQPNAEGEVQVQPEGEFETEHEHQETEGAAEGEEVQYLDGDAEGYQPTEEGEHVDSYALYIKEADPNQDGQITHEELQNFFVSFIVLDQVENVDDYVKTYFDMLDTNKDGHLSTEEFKALLQTAESAESAEVEEGEGEQGEEGTYESEEGEQGQQVDQQDL